jgi:DNA repair protein RecO (recombination protein O)
MSEIEFIQGKNRKTLTDAAIIEKFDNIPQDLGKFEIANSVADIFDNFIKGQEKDGDVFNLLREIFFKLNDKNLNDGKYEAIYYYFLWNFLALLGYLPEVEKCNVCRGKLNPYSVYFSNKSGGIICGKCLGHDNAAEKISSDIVKILRLIFKKEWQILSKLKTEPSSQKLLKEVSNNYYSYILSGHSFQSNFLVK